MNVKFEAILPEYQSDLERLGKSGASLTVFMHIPKTGGSSISGSLRTSEIQQGLWLPELGRQKDKICNCGDMACSKNKDRVERLKIVANQDNVRKSIFILSGGHMTYNSIKQCTDLLGITRKKGSVLTTVRPSQNRLVSMFRDYWTQVEFARETGLAGEWNTTAREPREGSITHVFNKQKRYLEDSAHYVDLEGNIDGPAWFTAFGEFGGGIPFFMDEVFQGNFRTFKQLVKSKRLRVVATNKVDALTAELTGALQPRRRTSLPMTPAIDKAIADSREIIIELAKRDAKYDKFLAKWLNDPEFLQAKA